MSSNQSSFQTIVQCSSVIRSLDTLPEILLSQSSGVTQKKTHQINGYHVCIAQSLTLHKTKAFAVYPFLPRGLRGCTQFCNSSLAQSPILVPWLPSGKPAPLVTQYYVLVWKLPLFSTLKKVARAFCNQYTHICIWLIYSAQNTNIVEEDTRGTHSKYELFIILSFLSHCFPSAFKLMFLKIIDDVKWRLILKLWSQINKILLILHT